MKRLSVILDKDNKISPYVILGFKFLIISLALHYIYREIFLRENIHDIVSFYRSVWRGSEFFTLILVTVLLMLCNWGMEAIKWKTMISRLQSISRWTAFKAVLTGVTVSFFTPNRVGEFGGRVFYLRRGIRIKASLITILCSMSQLLVTLIVGLIAFIGYFKRYMSHEPYLYSLITFFVILFALLFFTLFMYPSVITYFLEQVNRFKRFNTYFKVFSFYTTGDQMKIFVMSLTRYLIFTFQFIIMLKLFQVEIDFFSAFNAVALTFLAMAVVPTMALTEIGIRGSVALYFIGAHSANSIGIVTASFTLWLINLVLPALLGAVFIIVLKFNR
jgi:uncharacterized membrane protein YbhN (UPF0104 family)